jgi:transcriptional regulator with XRE-family HTH domain
MTTPRSDTSLGSQIRQARLDAGLSLRALAEQIKRAPSYLNDIEHNRRVPSESVIKDICSALGMDEDRLLAAAGRVGEGAEEFMKSQPIAGVLLRTVSGSGTVSGAGLGERDLKKLLKQAEKMIQDQDRDSDK